MIIEFLQDYCGRETTMREYKKGDRIISSFAEASELIKLGLAIEVDEQIEVTAMSEPKRKYIKSKRLEQPLTDGGEG